MKRHALFGTVVLLILMPRANAQKPFTLEQVMSAPFPSNLTAAKNANRIAWVLDQEGRRNIWVAEGPAFTARQLTKYNEDDGQELLDLHFSSDSNTIVYVRCRPGAKSHQQSCRSRAGSLDRGVERGRAQARRRGPFAADFSPRNSRVRQGWADLARGTGWSR